jgi:hypothetical protein
MAAAHHHFPKMDERKNKLAQGEATGCRTGSLILGMGGGNGTLLKPGFHPYLTPWADQPSPHKLIVISRL